MQVVGAETRKANGAIIKVDPSAIYEQPAPGFAQMGVVTDLRVKTVVFPQFAAGDTAAFTIRVTTPRPMFPGQFMWGETFTKALTYGNVRVSITAPKSLPLHVETHDMAFEQHAEGENAVYTWHYAANAETSNDIVLVSPQDHDARYFATTFSDYGALGQAYAAGSAPKVVVTDQVKALAEQIVGTERDRREQARKIYEWVSHHIRYVAIELGRGSFVPHDVDAIVANGYGDCKDHDLLLQALLKAKGIAAESVLIDTGNSYALTAVPTFARLGHVITFVPEFNLYLDSSVAVAPFGVLPYSEYGKPAVLALPSGSSLITMPLLKAEDNSTTVKTVAEIGKDGVLRGTTDTHATGPASIVLRLLGLGVQTVGPDIAGQRMMAAHGYGSSATGTLEAGSPMDLAPGYAMHASFAAPSWWADGTVGSSPFLLPGGLRVLGLSGDGMMGPFSADGLKDDEPTPCFSGHAVEDLSLKAPSGVKFSSVPEDTHVDSGDVVFTARWTLADGVMSVHREFTGTIATPLCSGDVRKRTAAALKTISDSYNTELSFDSTK
jgi:transglutaminase-like putative cysteine protease